MLENFGERVGWISDALTWLIDKVSFWKNWGNFEIISFVLAIFALVGLWRFLVSIGYFQQDKASKKPKW